MATGAEFERAAPGLARPARERLGATRTALLGKVYGTAMEADPAIRAACRDGWWTTFAAAPVRVFTVQIAEATLIDWDPGGGELVVTSWAASTGVRVRRRAYP